MNCENKMSLEFLSKSANESFARAVISAFAAQLDPTLEEISDIKIAVSEAVTNSIIHGYGNRKGTVKLDAYITDNLLTVSISDAGKGIENTELARKPLYTEVPEQERSGMGFTVMETFMDTVDVKSELNKGTCVTMTKTIKR